MATGNLSPSERIGYDYGLNQTTSVEDSSRQFHPEVCAGSGSHVNPEEASTYHYSHSSNRHSDDVFRPRPPEYGSRDNIAGSQEGSNVREHSAAYPSEHVIQTNYSHSSYVASAPSSESTNHSYHPHHAPSMYFPPPHPSYHPHRPAPPGGYSYGMVPPAKSSSFESHGRAPAPMGVPPATYSSYGPPPPGGYPYHAYPPWAMGPPVEYISSIKPNDVLSGRGGATNSHSGNRAFRSFVKQYQAQYLKAKKRDKPSVASIIVEKIREKGGRFLRRVENSPQGHVLWVDIGDDRAREKTCQALREGAPEIRRKRKADSMDKDDDDTKPSYHNKDTYIAHSSSSSSIDRTSSVEQEMMADEHVWNTKVARRARFVTETDQKVAITCEEETDGQNSPDGPIMIRPAAKLIRRRVPESISVDQLEPHERDLYLRDYLPPNPDIRRKPAKNHVIHARQIYASSARDEKTWPVVQV